MSYYRNLERRKNTLSGWPHVIATVFICLSCRVMGYFYSSGFPLEADEAVMPFWGSLIKWLNSKEKVYILGVLILLLISFLIQRINDMEMLIRERTRLVFVIFFLFSSTNIGIIPFNNVTVVLLCLVLMIYELFKTFHLPEATGRLFNAGVYIGLASLFLPQALWFIPLLWIGMYQLLSFTLRSFAASLLGMLTVYWLALTWCVWKHDYSIFTMLYHSMTDFQLFSVFLSIRYFHIGFAMIALMMIPIFLNIKIDAINNRLRIRQMLSFLLNMAIWSIVLLCFYGGSAGAFFIIFYLPFAVLMAYFLENMRKPFQFLLYYFLLVINVISFALRIWSH